MHCWLSQLPSCSQYRMWWRCSASILLTVFDIITDTLLAPPSRCAGGKSNEGSSLLINPMDLDVYFHAWRAESQAGAAYTYLHQASVSCAAPQDTVFHMQQRHRALPFEGRGEL